MPLIDERGRLFGRFNVVDAAVLLLVGVLIPMAYAAYLIFRPPTARILALEPATIEPGTTEVNVRAEHLRPYLRVVVGGRPAPLLFENTNGGALRLPALPPGAYDVLLFDEEAEVSRLPGGLVVAAKGTTVPGTVDLMLRCTFWPEELALLNTLKGDNFGDGISLTSVEVTGQAASGQLWGIVRLRAAADETADGWYYKGQVLRVGELFTVERPGYKYAGYIVDLDQTAAAEGGD